MCSRYHQAFFQLAKTGRLPKEAHPRISTIDKMQGDEYDLVIADFVVVDAVSRGGLGFNRDDGRCNVAFTRAKSAFVTVLPVTMKNEPSNDDNASAKSPKGKEPFLVEYVEFMYQRLSIPTVEPIGKSNSSFDSHTDLDANQKSRLWLSIFLRRR